MRLHQAYTIDWNISLPSIIFFLLLIEFDSMGKDSEAVDLSSFLGTRYHRLQDHWQLMSHKSTIEYRLHKRQRLSPVKSRYCTHIPVGFSHSSTSLSLIAT